MAISANPTRTITIEKNWLREINRRWREFERIAVERLESMNSDELVVNKSGDFTLSASRQRVYMAFLQNMIDQLLLGTSEPPNWQARHQIAAYERGLESTRRALISQGARIVPTPAEQAASLGITTISATPSLGVALAGAGPIHQEALEFLTTRSYTKLKGWTDEMATQTRQILFDGVAEGQGIDEVVRNMRKRIDVSRTRARVIARTETNQAYARSAIAEAKRASEEIGEEVSLRWLTVRDTRVRHLHATWHGTVSTPEETARRKNVSPWNCRCGIAPVIAEANTPAKTEKFARERKELLRSEAKG